MRNIKLTIEYDGTNYSGWQRQPNAVTIQQTIENAIFNITRKNSELIGCSRTDAGVHAKKYIANFHTESLISAEKFVNALNSQLPQDISILNSIEVSPDFHSRYSSKGKMYSYTILNRYSRPAIYRNYAMHVRRTIDVEAMRKALEYFKGTHDFSAFMSTGSSIKTTIRTINDIKIESTGGIIKIFISANGFLYNMARIIVGTLLNVGTQKNLPEDVKNIIKIKDRKKAGDVVPAAGLCLEEVYY